MKNQISNARISFNPVFLGIVKENHAKIVRLDARIKKTGEELAKTSGEDHVNRTERKIQLLETELAKASLIVVVFSAMAIEAYIYDYAARHLGDAFVKDRLDKLDTLSKWIVIPELVTGKKLSLNQKWYALLKNLIKTRNTVTHHKSSDIPASPLDIEKHLNTLNEAAGSIHKTARQSITLLEILADKIIEIDPEETPWVKSYLA